MTPVVDDEAGALGEHLVAVVELADEVRDDLLEVLVEHLHFAVGAGRHGLEPGVGLALDHAFLVQKGRRRVACQGHARRFLGGRQVGIVGLSEQVLVFVVLAGVGFGHLFSLCF